MHCRWKRDDKREQVKDSSTCLPVLQFVAIQRRDTKEWAIPGVSDFSIFLFRMRITINL